MSSAMTSLKMAAAALTVAVGFASAEGLKAEIPFAFKAGSAMMPAGSYTLYEKGNGGRYIQLRSADTGHSVLLVPVSYADPMKEWTKDAAPKLAFVCGDGACSLQQLWDGYGPAYNFHMPAVGKDTKTRIAVIVMHRDSGE